MNIKSFRKPPLSENGLYNLTQAVDDYVRPLTNNPILGGRIIENIPITTSSLNVAHSLGQAWRGWWVVRKTDDINVWEASTQATPSLFISLTGSGTGTVDIYIF